MHRKTARVSAAAAACVTALSVLGVTEATVASAAAGGPPGMRASSRQTSGAPAPGATLWVGRYNGPANGFDFASSVAVSRAGGTVFVTGDSAGKGSNSDYATVAYRAATGARLWVSRYDGPAHGNDSASSLAASPSGSVVFVTGRSRGLTSGNDYATVAYSAATGARLWVSRYSGPGTRGDSAASVAVSPSGSTVYVTGTSTGATSGRDYLTLAYSAATGARLWVSRYNGPAGRFDQASALTVGPGGGKVFVTGESLGRTSGSDYATVAYSAATGARLWARRYNGPANRDDVANSLAVAPGGREVVVTGTSNSVGLDVFDARGVRSAATPTPDYATVAYGTATGARLWVSRYDGQGHGMDFAYKVAVSPKGNKVFVTGFSIVTASYADYATVACSAVTGARLWARRYNGPANSGDAFPTLAVGPAGTVFVTGTSTGVSSGQDYATIAYHG